MDSMYMLENTNQKDLADPFAVTVRISDMVRKNRGLMSVLETALVRATTHTTLP